MLKPVIERMIRQAFPEDPDTAVAIARAESGFNFRAANWRDSHRGCNGSFGIFQIACVHDDEKKLYDPKYNIQRARDLYDQYGWQPWGAYTNKSYLAYIR